MFAQREKFYAGATAAMSGDAFLVVAFVLGYLLGSIPFGLVLTKLAGTQDLRSIGSGNIGATNVLRTGHKGLAAATLIGDALKGTVAVVIAGYYGGPDAAMLAALGAFLGHLFPVWLKFQGGKGVATYIGVLIGLFWPAAIMFCRDVARDRLHHPLLVALGAGRGLRHAAVPVVVRPPGAGVAVRRADVADVLHAPRKHQAVAGGHRRQDRGEVDAIFRFNACSDKPRRRQRLGIRAISRDDLHADRQSAVRDKRGTLTQGTPISVHSRL